MAWRKCGFLAGLWALREGFRSSPDYDVLALVWRTGGEYSVMPSWLVDKIVDDLDEHSLRVVMWVTRSEMAELCDKAGWGEI